MLRAGLTSPGLQQFANRLRAGQGDVARQASRAAQAQAELAAFEVRARTPVSAGGTGHRHLRDTVYAVRESGWFLTWAVEIRGPHAPFVEEDTAPHLIRPRRAKVLRFVSGGRVIFARQVRHPGTRGRHMLRDGVAAGARRSVRVVAGYLAAHTRSLTGGGSGA